MSRRRGSSARGAIALAVPSLYDLYVMQLSSFYTFVSVVLVSAVSLVGIALFLVREEVMKRLLLYFVSFSTGALLGDVFIHLLPEIVEENSALSRSFFTILFGIVFSFVIEKFIHWRHCHLLPEDQQEQVHDHDVGAMSLFGDAIHNFVDGLVIAASFIISFPVGVSTTIAVLLHEIPSEIGNFAVLLHAGYTRKQAILWNGLSAVTAIVGAGIALLGVSAFSQLNAYLLPFAAGNLLYIAGSDLIPELHRESALSKAAGQLLCMIAGIGIMYLLLFVE